MTSEDDLDRIVGGVDTHADTIHVAALTAIGLQLGDQEFPTTPMGYQRALEFLSAFGAIEVIGIEGTSSYGAGITRAALAQGHAVLEVVRPDRAERRRLGKSDPIDAYQAARAAIAHHRTSPAKNPSLEGIRALHNARRSATKARTAAIAQMHQILVTSPDEIREKYRGLRREQLVRAVSRSRPTTKTDPNHRAVMTALRALAERCTQLQAQHAAMGKDLDHLVTATNPSLRAVHGIGPDTAAQLLLTAGGNPQRLRNEASFAALCGVAPVPASSGKTTRHRLCRGGDRGANNALYRIALVRMSHDQRTKEFITRQRQAGRSTAEAIRILKRGIAREVFRQLTRPATVPTVDDLRPLRQSKNLTITAAAHHFGIWPAVISEIERGTRRDDQLANAYRQWLHAA